MLTIIIRKMEINFSKFAKLKIYIYIPHEWYSERGHLYGGERVCNNTIQNVTKNKPSQQKLHTVSLLDKPDFLGMASFETKDSTHHFFQILLLIYLDGTKTHCLSRECCHLGFALGSCCYSRLWLYLIM